MNVLKHTYVSGWLVMGILLLFPALGYCFSATAQVDRTRIPSQDMVSFRVVVDGGKAQIDLSVIEDFQVMSSGSQTSRSYTNGEWQHQVVYQYTLVPKKKGVLTIPPLTVSQKGEAVMTREIQILVSDTPASDQDQQAFFSKATLSSTEIVLGQQAVYTLKLYAAGNFAGASFDPPEFGGLMARELTKWKKYTQNIKGRVFVVNEVKFLIQGETAGDYEISPAVFMAKKPVGGSRDPLDSFFDDSFFRTTRTRPVRVVSNPVFLTVAPLPPYTGDSPFSGLVGSFTINTSLDTSGIKVGESATLTITIQGTGNIMDAGVPALDLDKEQFKVYADSPVENIRAGEDGFEGEKIFKQALVPNVPGQVTIPSIALTFFDAASKTYKTIATDPIQLDVIPGEPVTLVQSGTGITSSNDAVSGKNGKQEVVLRNRDILDIREDITGISTDTHLSMPWFIFLLLLPGVGFALSNIVFGLKTRDKTVREKLVAKAGDHLAAAGKKDPGDPLVLPLVQSALTAGILARGEKQAESLTREEARLILSRSDVDEKLTGKTLALMDTMDAARFGGKTMDGPAVQDCLVQVRGIIKKLCVILCIGVVLFHAPVPASAGTSNSGAADAAASADQTTEAIKPEDMAGLFIDSTRAYKAGDFQTAAGGFETIAGTGIKNPDLFYNTGNAYLKSNDIGRAILWYERAKRLNPGDPDLKFNLAHARTQVIDKTDTSLTFRDILFFWQGLISLKWLQFIAIAASVFFFTWAGLRKLTKKRIFSGTGSVLCILFCTFVLVAGLETFRLNADSFAVILKEQVAIRSGTLETATPLFDLHAGTRVRVMEKKGKFIKIRFAKGKVGWVSLEEAQII